VTALDLLLIKRSILGITPLIGPASNGADASRDSLVSALDLLIVKRQILELATIPQ